MIPKGRKAGFEIFVREVFEFAVEEFICFFDGGVAVIIRARGPRPYGRDRREKFRGICFAPLGVGIRIGGDGGFEPHCERTFCPGVLRGLLADESGAEADGVGEAKG